MPIELTNFSDSESTTVDGTVMTFLPSPFNILQFSESSTLPYYNGSDGYETE